MGRHKHVKMKLPSQTGRQNSFEQMFRPYWLSTTPESILMAYTLSR